MDRAWIFFRLLYLVGLTASEWGKDVVARALNSVPSQAFKDIRDLRELLRVYRSILF